ncbi:uncharacterized protein LOC106666757 [Cimex lectularius]|uniref:Protein with signal anchor n=1 Tax=Cimex lectularius TaxID=79782 RepID=A0A8I6RNB6_CIMLE|nr:uncharacterized protein LOC106666757 [Cimex lectularius]
MKADKHLCLLYVSACFGTLVVFVASMTAWLYWDKALNTCQYNELDLSRNCGCILYSKWGDSFIKGGDVRICYFAVLSPVPIIIWTAFYALYHGYRSFCTTTKVKVTLITKNGVDAVNTQLWSRPILIFAIILCVLSSVLLFSEGVIVTDGYLKTCDQYKKSLVKELSASGALAKAIHDRIPCEALYDFLDYLQPDPPTLEDKYRRGAWRIQTNIVLTMSIYGSWVCFVILIFLTVLNIRCIKIPRKRPILNTSL